MGHLDGHHDLESHDLSHGQLLGLHCGILDLKG